MPPKIKVNKVDTAQNSKCRKYAPHNAMHCGQRTLEQRPRATRAGDSVKLGGVVSRIRQRSDKQTDKQTYLLQYYAAVGWLVAGVTAALAESNGSLPPGL